MPDSTNLDLKQFIRDVPDFPKEGILFRDITPLLASPDALRDVNRRLADKYRDAGIDVILAAEARGFIFAVPLAMELNAAFAPVRKPGKLPYETHSYSYELEYGTDTLEIHTDAISAGQNVLVLDDLLATGGTVEACCKLVEKVGGKIAGCAFVIELGFLNGRQRLVPHEVFSLITY